MTEPWPVIDAFGPTYPALAGVDKYRRAAARAGALSAMTREERRAYGRAVFDALAKMNQPRPKPHPCPCASGTWHADGKAILKAIRSKAP